MINENMQCIHLNENMDERVEGILKDIELAVQWRRPIILFSVYGSDFVRRDIQMELENRLFDIGYSSIDIKLSKLMNQNLFQAIESHSNRKNSIFIISFIGLSIENQKRQFEYLNNQRDYFLENKIIALFWLTQSEVVNLARTAPNFWECRHQVVEFTESPKSDLMLQRTLESTWQGTGEYDDQIEDTDEKISLRESLLTNLPQNPESNSIRANMLLTLGVLQWRKGEFEKAENLLQKAMDISIKIDNRWLEAECLNAYALVCTSLGQVGRAIDAYKQAIRLLPNQIFAWNNLGNLCAKVGRNDEAIVAFSKAIECNPEDSVAWNGLGNVYKQIGYFDDAINAFRKSIKFIPSYAQPWCGLGDVYANMGRVEEAIDAFEHSIKTNRSYPTPLVGLGDLYARQGNHRDAVKSFQRALYIDEKNKDIWNKLGIAQLGCNEHAAAEQSFRNALKIDRTYGSAYCNLGLVYMHQKKFEYAIEHFQKSLKFIQDASERSVIWSRLGDTFRSINKYEEAIQAYKKADNNELDNLKESEETEEAFHPMEPTDRLPQEKDDQVSELPSLVVNLETQQKSDLKPAPYEEIPSSTIEPPQWLLQQQTGETELRYVNINEIGEYTMSMTYPETISSVDELPKNKSESPATDSVGWNEVGNEHFRSGNYAEAIVAYNKSVQKDPEFGMPYANMGAISLLQERFSEAILLYKKSIQMLMNDEEKAIAYNGLGNAYRGVGEYDNAVDAFRMAAQLDPYSAGMRDQKNVFTSKSSLKNSAFWVELGTAFLENCSFNEAVTCLLRAVELNPKDGQAFFRLGKAFSYSRKYTEAVSAFTKSIDLLASDKEKSTSLNYLGNAYRKLNDYDKAIDAFQKAVVLSDEGVNLATRARFSLLSNCYSGK